MKMRKLQISPDEIRAIRKELGLSQVEAGELLGGGPRAFTKYEAGTVKPAASVVNLLRLLEANPAALTILRGDRSHPMTMNAEPRPFEVTPEHITVLTPRMFAGLLRRLLNAEANANDLPRDGIHVASNITAPDGGEDGRIKWEGRRERTSFLPSRFCQFQLKVGTIFPAAAGHDVLKPNTTEVKEMVRAVLESGGHYIMLCAQPYVQKAIMKRELRIREALHSGGLNIGDHQVQFRDADQIAAWVNHHPSVAIWLKEQTQPGTIGPFRSWSHWAGRAEHESSPWVEDTRLAKLQVWLLQRVKKPRQYARVVGLAGVGKSRLVMESLRAVNEKDGFLSDMVLYADESEVGSVAVNRIVQNLADMGTGAILVVDRCIPKTHQILVGMVSRSSSRLSLITIDDEIPTGKLDENSLFLVGEAPSSVVESIITRVAPTLPSKDVSRVVNFSSGFPGLAIRIAQTWTESVPVANATEDEFVDGIILGRSPREPGLLLKSARLVATFGFIGMKPPSDQTLNDIAELGGNLPTVELRAAIARLIERGVAQRRGTFVVLQPRPVSMNLSRRQWREWSPDVWNNVLGGDTSPQLKVSAARRLSLLNTTEIAREVVAHVCRYGGPFDGFEGISRTGHAEVLSALAEIDSEVVVRQIERSLGTVRNLKKIAGDVRRQIVRALEKITFHAGTFEDGARLLLRLAAAENEAWANNATGQFTRLFPVLLGNTAADGHARLCMLDEATDTEDPIRLKIATEALIEGSKTGHFWRDVGAENQGTRPALESWRPATKKEANNYLEGCVERLTKIAERPDETGVIARAGLGRHLRSLVLMGFIDSVETAVERVVIALGHWTEAGDSLGHLLVHKDSCKLRKVTDRVKKLITMLQPRSLESRVRFFVTEMPWSFPWGENSGSEDRYRRQDEAVRTLVADLVKQPAVIKRLLPQLSRGKQRMTYSFGKAMADSVDSPADWLERIILAVLKTPLEDRNFDLLSGYVAGVAERHPNIVDCFKRKAAQSPELAPSLPLVCSRIGITSSDIQLIIGTLRGSLLPVGQLHHWTSGGGLHLLPVSSVAPLFDTLLEDSIETSPVPIELMGLYTYGVTDRLDSLRPQIRKVVENATRWAQLPADGMVDYNFERVTKWILTKGRQDPDACATALILAKSLVNSTGWLDDRLIRPAVPVMLSNFPEITWPLLGQAILSDQRQTWRFADILGDRSPLGGEQEPAILSLPEDVLFAWCHAHPEHAPAFAAGIVPILTTHQTDTAERSLHPVMARLIEEFGDRKGMLEAVSHNLYNFGWSGPRANYYALYQKPLEILCDDPKWQVRRWAKNMLRDLRKEIENASNEYEERAAEWEV